jgi:demethylmenaquinone methyltransferase/2-methoxy-6-polyprenyl-1,4-benzoquinol methylase
MNLESVRNTYTRFAPYYDATHTWMLPKRRRARMMLGVRPGDRVLDVACGTGLNFAHLRELAGDAGCVMGVDVTPAMLDIARRRIARHGWANVQVREADAARLPFPGATFDRAICAYAVHVIPDYAQAIDEVRRVLVPGGRFVVLDVELTGRSLSRWPDWLLHLCAVHAGHQVGDELQRAFADVTVHAFWAGLINVAVAQKER